MEQEVLNQENAITFKEIFDLLKKGWVTLVISLVISVLLATAVLLVIREVTSTTSYETEITFSSASISEDEEFNPSTKVNSLIKSGTIVSNALTKCGYTSEQQQDMLKNGLISDLSAYVNESVGSTESVAYPYSVVLSLRKNRDIKMSRAQCTALIEELTKQVIAELIKEYRVEISFAKLESIDFSQANYLQAYETISIANNKIETLFETVNSGMLNYKVNGKSLRMYKENLATVESDLAVLKMQLIKGAIANSSAVISEKEFATSKYNYYTQQEADLNDKIAQYAILLDSIKPEITITAGGATFEALDNYYKLVDRYNELRDEYSIVVAKQAEWKELMDAYASTTTQSDAVKTSFANLVTAYNDLYDNISTIIDTYNDDAYSSTLVAETKVAKKYQESPVTPLIIILCEVVAIVVCLVSVVAGERKKEKKTTIKEAK